MFIVSLIIILGGIVIMFTINGIREKQEADLNRKYEVSLVKALKNSYRDLEEIKIQNPSKSEITGVWHCDLTLKFTNKDTITYRLGHNLSFKINRGAAVNAKELAILERHEGITTNSVQVTFSKGDKRSW